MLTLRMEAAKTHLRGDARDEAIVAFVSEYFIAHGDGPSFAELRTATGIPNGTLFILVRRLARERRLHFDPSTWRSLRPSTIC